MSLRDRLRSMQGATAPATTASSAAYVATSPPATPTIAPEGLTRELDALLPGAVHETPHGSCYVVERRYPLTHAHGHTSLDTAAFGSIGDGVMLLARAAADRAAIRAASLSRFVFLDTETTGLAGGTGTYAFLVGVARYVGTAFVVRQFFMRTLAEEHALLHLLAADLDECDIVVTYNGKAFDWPLLETRYALGRRTGPQRPRDPKAHVDLLFAARRLWRARLEGCSLAQVESHALGVRRRDDTPGWLIPQLYFAYLRRRDIGPLVGVFRHNALDLLSLAGLLGRIASMRAARRPDTAALAESLPSALPLDELAALGRCFEEAGEFSRALDYLQLALQSADASPSALHLAIAGEARARIGGILKRLGRHADAVPHWEALIADARSAGGLVDVRPYEELAKYYEHGLRDPRAAHELVVRALALLDASAGRQHPRTRAQLLHRLARLERGFGAG